MVFRESRWVRYGKARLDLSPRRSRASRRLRRERASRLSGEPQTERPRGALRQAANQAPGESVADRVGDGARALAFGASPDRRGRDRARARQLNFGLHLIRFEIKR